MLHKIFKYTIILLLSFTFTTCASSAPQKGLLWKISGNGLYEPSYLFGTHHLAPLSFLDSIDGLHDAFLSTKQTIGELDINNIGELQMQLMIASLMPEGLNYDNLMSSDDKEILNNTLLQYLGMGLEQFEQMKPAMLSTLLSVMMYKKMYPSDEEDEISMDEYFQNEARNHYRQTLGLESVQDQIDVLLDAQSIEKQVESLLCTIKNMEYGKKQMDKLMRAYFAQDLEALAQLYEEEDPKNPCPSTQEEKDAMNKDRNIKWMDKIPDIIQKKPSFIAIGCLHLVGKDGLINLLQQEGYKLEAIY